MDKTIITILRKKSAYLDIYIALGMSKMTQHGRVTSRLDPMFTQVSVSTTEINCSKTHSYQIFTSQVM